MARIYIFIFFMATFSVMGQTQAIERNVTVTTTDTTYTAMYNRLKDLYTIYKYSDSHVYKGQLMETFFRKTRITMKDILLANDHKAMFEWIAKNIDNTGFESYDAAVADWELIGKANEIAMKENAELFKYVIDATKIHGNKIFADVVLDVELIR